MIKRLIKKLIKRMDYYILIPVVFLCTIGVIMVYSAGIGAEFFGGKGITAIKLFKTQLVAVGIGTFGAIILLLLPYRFLDKKIMRVLIWIISILILASVLLFGREINGSKSWILIAGVSVQPSEFCKIALVALLASRYSRLQQQNNPFWSKTMKPMYLIAVPMFVLVLKQGDLGTMAVMATICFGILLTSGYKLKRLLVIFTPFIVIGYLGTWLIATGKWVIPSGGYRLNRFLNMINPFLDMQDTGLQLANSYIAIASGGIQGVGLGEGIQKYGYLPEAQTDFIMSIIAEELGFFGVFTILLCYAILIGRMLYLALKCKDAYGSIICIGIATMLMAHIIFNIGAMVGIVPLTGVPLPMLSSGGSSMIAVLIGIGLILHVSAYVKEMDNKSTQVENI